MSDKSHIQSIEYKGRFERYRIDEEIVRLIKAEEEKRRPSRSTKRRVFIAFSGHGHGKALDADVEPPKGLLIDLLVPPDQAEDRLLQLQKAFEERWVPKYGTRRARRMFVTQSIGSVIGFWINWMMKHLSLLKFFASGRG
jgi:hypothetical protein